MTDFISSYLEQLSNFLHKPIAVGFLVTVVWVLFCVWGFFSWRNKKRFTELNQRVHELEIIKATQTQQVENLTNEKKSFLTKVETRGEQINSLIGQVSNLQSSRDEISKQLNQVGDERTGLLIKNEVAQKEINKLTANYQEKLTYLGAEKEKLAELKAQFEEQKKQLENHFKVISEKVIKDRQKILSEQNKEGVGALLKPLQEQINGFQKRINEVHDESVKGNSSLRTEIENVMKMGIKMSGDAQSLTTALKGDSQQSGAWGEAQLERTLEMSGLIEDHHFEKQSSFVGDDGKTKRTDYIIKLPGDKCIVIDSKVSLNDYERAVSGDKEQHNVLMQKHCDAVRTHIKDLASKEYTNLNGIHSPDFVLMFMPIEPAYIEAMKHDKSLFSFGYERNVILVSHTTLIPILRTVSNLWMLDRSNKEARQLGEKASDIYNSVATVSERLESLGKTLATASGHYNKTVKALSGNQGLQGKVERFTELSNKANKKMPKLEQKYVEYETQKLQVESLDPDTKK